MFYKETGCLWWEKDSISSTSHEMACGKISLGFLCFMLICKALNHLALDGCWGKRFNGKGNSDLSMSFTEYPQNHRDFLVTQVGVFCPSCSWTYQSVGKGRTCTFGSVQLTSIWLKIKSRGHSSLQLQTFP